MRLSRSLIAVASLAALPAAACGEMQAIGFSLPEGDANVGRELFVDYACNDCHSVAGHEEMREGVWASMDVPLGGATTHIATYGELVTSVINPSHRVSERYDTDEFVDEGESVMRNYNQVMSVADLVDLVTFLQEQYDLVEYPMTEYSRYHYP